MEKFLPTSKTKQSKLWGIKKKKKKDFSNIPTNLPYPQIDPGYQQYYEMMKKTEQAAADITGPLQVRAMVYTLYIVINLTTDNKQQIRKWYTPCILALILQQTINNR